VSERVYQDLSLTERAPFPRSWYIKRILWQAAWILCDFLPSRFFKPRIWLLRLFGASVANTARVRKGVRIRFPWNLRFSWTRQRCESACLHLRRNARPQGSQASAPHAAHRHPGSSVDLLVGIRGSGGDIRVRICGWSQCCRDQGRRCRWRGCW
jgi:hypothetical protein